MLETKSINDLSITFVKKQIKNSLSKDIIANLNYLFKSIIGDFNVPTCSTPRTGNQNDQRIYPKNDRTEYLANKDRLIEQLNQAKTRK